MLKGDNELIRALLDPAIADDPEAFVMFAFPWGKVGTPLARYKGPRTWQRGVLIALREFIHAMQRHDLQKAEEKLEVFRQAIASGRGIGKSALVAWIIFWFLSTRIGGTAIISANTEAQLRQITWGELGKWHTLLINKHWFDLSATSIKPAKWFEQLVQEQLKRGTKYYYAEAKLWSEENPDAYAGAHNPLGMLLVFDEASGIPAPIWTVAEGYFTEPIVDRFWLAFSNPRKNAGAFFECFHRNRDFWRTEHIDSRTVEGTDKNVYERLIAQYGEDSDEARVEVKGQFPRQGERSFISRGEVREAMERDLVMDEHAALIMGVDIARFGTDSSVARFRKGRDARSISPLRWKGLDNMALAYELAAAIDEHKPDAVAIDAGNGTGVIDRLREMGYKVQEVWFGSKSDEPEYGNRRAMMWGRLKEWLPGGCLDESQVLEDDLCGPNKKFARNGDAIMLESKDEMLKRGLHSPDDGDALALTFSVRVSRKDSLTARRPADSGYNAYNSWPASDSWLAF